MRLPPGYGRKAKTSLDLKHLNGRFTFDDYAYRELKSWTLITVWLEVRVLLGAIRIKLINKCHFLNQLLGLDLGADFCRRDGIGWSAHRLALADWHCRTVDRIDPV
jgi:hypothetical protein